MGEGSLGGRISLVGCNLLKPDFIDGLGCEEKCWMGCEEKCWIVRDR